MDNISRLMPPARWRIVCVALLVAAIIFSILSYVDASPVMQNGAIISLVLAVCGTLGFWRCPRCRKLLPLVNMMNLKQCPRCKVDIRNF